MKRDRGPRKAAAGAALGLSLAFSLAGCGGREPGYPGEPVEGLGGMAWLGPPVEGILNSESVPGGTGPDLLRHEVDGLLEAGPGLVAGARLEREDLWGVPPEFPTHYLFLDKRLIAAVHYCKGAGLGALRERLGEPHEEKRQGTSDRSYWFGKVADVEVRTFGGPDDLAAVHVKHRESFETIAGGGTK